MKKNLNINGYQIPIKMNAIQSIPKEEHSSNSINTKI